MADNVYVDVEAKLERIKEFRDYSSTKLDLQNQKITLFTDELGNTTNPLSFTEGINEIATMHKNRLFELSSLNGIRILNEIPGRMLDVKEKLDQKFEDLLELVDELNDAIENLKDEVSSKEAELKDAHDMAQQLREEMNNNKFDILQNQINNLTTTLMQQNTQTTQQQKSPDSYFQEDIEKQPVGELIEEDSSKKQEIQSCHEEIIELMKGEGLYPLHKIDTKRAKETYLEMWGFVIPNYSNLSEKDYPEFIDNLEDYSNEEENYLDFVEAV